MTTSMSKSQITRFVRICEDQGIGITRTKKGLLLRFPDGTSSTQHFTNSDVRAEKNQIARFRRAGMIHPNDTRRQTDDLPSYITGGTITDHTRDKITNYVVSKGCPDSVLASTVVRDLNADPAWVNRALYHTGFRPGTAKSKKIGRPWYTPADILEMRVNEEVPAGEKETTETIDVAPVDLEEQKPPLPTFDLSNIHSLHKPEVEAVETAPETVEETDEIDYIDERDSWVVDMKEVFGENVYRMVQDKLRVLDAVGIQYELRVWR